MCFFEKKSWGKGHKVRGLEVLFGGLLFFWGASVAIFLWATLAMAQPCGRWVEVEVNPPHPTSNDFITLTLSGVWCDSCVPRSPRAVVVGNTIMVYTTNKDAMCFPVLTPWELGVPLGKLPPGRYSVLVIHNGQPIGGLEILEVRAAGPDLLIEAIRWTPLSPNVGDRDVNFEVMIVNVGSERASLAGVVLELYKIKAGQAIVVGKTSWGSGYLDPNQTMVANVTTFPYSALTWEGGVFPVRACVDVTDVLKENDEKNNCLERPITIQGAAALLLVTAGCITLPSYSLLDVPIGYQVKNPLGTIVETGTSKTPFTLAYPKGFQVVLDAPDSHDLHRLWQWRIVGNPPGFSPDPVTVNFDPTNARVEALYTVMPERKCSECFKGTLGARDTCGNGTGYSVPGPAGGDPHCQTPDCCGWYQLSHVHDLGQIFVNVHLILEYTPGFADGCQGTLTVEISPDGQNWSLVYSGPTTTVDLNPPQQLWGTYILCIQIPRMTPFRYVRVTIPNCYVDHSAVYVCAD